MEKSYNCDVPQYLTNMLREVGKVHLIFISFVKGSNILIIIELKWATFSISISYSHFSTVLYTHIYIYLFFFLLLWIRVPTFMWMNTPHWNYKHLRKLLCINVLHIVSREKSVIKSYTCIHYFYSIYPYVALSISKVLLSPVHVCVYTAVVHGENCEKWPTPVQMLCSLISRYKRQAKQSKQAKKIEKERERTIAGKCQ